MSGGSMKYLYLRLEDAEFEQDTLLRIAFAEHLKKVQKALHDIEWVDSGDYGIGDENAAILACIEDAAMLDWIETHGHMIMLGQTKLAISADRDGIRRAMAVRP